MQDWCIMMYVVCCLSTWDELKNKKWWINDVGLTFRQLLSQFTRHTYSQQTRHIQHTQHIRKKTTSPTNARSPRNLIHPTISSKPTHPTSPKYPKHPSNSTQPVDFGEQRFPTAFCNPPYGVIGSLPKGLPELPVSQITARGFNFFLVCWPCHWQADRCHWGVLGA